MRTYIYSLCFVALYYYETLFYIHVVLSSNHVLVIIQIKLLPLLLSTLLPLLLLLLLLLFTLFGFVFLQIFPHALFYHFQFRVQFSVFSFLLFYFCMSFFVYFLYPCRNCFFFRLCTRVLELLSKAHEQFPIPFQFFMQVFVLIIL